ncbi:MAG: GNAT family N-acetyltransferase [Gemmataceae bacterium]|nr:GNAT family N-acetyltransferase [Gemmataceae bacterium]
MGYRPAGSERIVLPAAYFKRYRMERMLEALPAMPELPAGFTWQSWSPMLLDVHAEVKYRSFRDEMDVEIFPSLGYLAGCRELMHNIATRCEFVPEATWLIVGPDGPCATIQGLREGSCGSIQNVGVVPEQRGKGLGAALVLKALHGFQRRGFERASLEVTSQNGLAVRLYQRLGFRATRILYKPTHKILQDEALVI